MIRNSRPMSWAEANRLPSGGRRSAQRAPAASATAYVRFDRPPEMRSKVSGGSTPSTFSANQRSTPAASIASRRLDSLLGHGRKPIALVVDFGGVLTTSIWPASPPSARARASPRRRCGELFRGDAEALKLLRGLETGELADADFEQRFGELLGVADHEGLIARMFAGLEPEPAMVDAVRAARSAGVKTGLISNSWGLGIYDRRAPPTSSTRP